MLCWYLPVRIEDLLGQHTGVETKALVNSWPFLNQDLVLVIGVIPSKKLSWSSVMNSKIWGCFRFDLEETTKNVFYILLILEKVYFNYLFVRYVFLQRIWEMRSKWSMECLILFLLPFVSTKKSVFSSNCYKFYSLKSIFSLQTYLYFPTKL